VVLPRLEHAALQRAHAPAVDRKDSDRDPLLPSQGEAQVGALARRIRRRLESELLAARRTRND
jgi:hypothetical protein